MAYVGGAAAVYLFLTGFAGLDIEHPSHSVFLWWRPGLTAFIGCVGIISPAIYLGARAPDDCRECVKAARKYARLETERDELKRALVELPVDRITERR